MALLPRYFARALKNTIKPGDDILVQVETRKEMRRGENMMKNASEQSPIFR